MPDTELVKGCGETVAHLTLLRRTAPTETNEKLCTGTQHPDNTLASTPDTSHQRAAIRHTCDSTCNIITVSASVTEFCLNHLRKTSSKKEKKKKLLENTITAARF
jgi:hypothetical protein